MRVTEFMNVALNLRNPRYTWGSLRSYLARIECCVHADVSQIFRNDLFVNCLCVVRWKIIR